MLRPQPYPYNWKGFKECLAFSLLLISFFGTITWFLAPEEIACHKQDGGGAGCTLTRKAWNIGVYRRTIHDVQDAVVMDPPPDRFSSDSDSDPVYRVHLLSRTGHLEAVGVDDREDAEHSVQAVKAFLADPQSPHVRTELSGQPGRIRTLALYAFVLGLALIPLWLLGYLLPFTRP